MYTHLLLLAACALPCLAGDALYRCTEELPDASVLESDGSSTTIRFVLPALTGSETCGPAGGTILRVPGWGELAATGCPDLPVLRRLVMVPDHGDVHLEIIEETTTVLGIYDIPPRQEPVLRSGATHAFVEDLSVYGSDEPYPSSCAEVEGVQVLRDIRAARVRFQPVRYNPATGEVTLVTSATVRLTFEGTGENELDRSFAGTTPGFLPIYREVLGYEPRGPFLDGSYVFLGTSQSLSAIEELIDWKRERGYRVVTAEVPAVGSSAAEIDAWIELSFEMWQYPPEWILIAGGEDMVPVTLYGGFASDNIYGVIGTSTSVPSIHVGRITGTLEDLEYQAWKVLQHEANPYEPGFSWLQKAVTIGSADGLDPLHSWEHTQMFMQNGIAVNYYCDSPLYGGAPPEIPAIAANINEGRTVVDYIGHGWEQGWGSSGFSSTDVAALTNGRMLPWVNSIACSNADFIGGYCFGEAWMTEGDIEDPRGGLGFMGATTGSPFGPTDSLAEYTWRGYFELGMHHMGAAVDYGKLKVEEFYGGGGWENNMMHMVFGCPEVDIYSDTSPIALLGADHSQYVWTGPWPVYVNIDGSTAVQGALVGLVQNDVLLGSGYTDANGYLALDISELPYGDSAEATLTVTAHNCRPYTASLEPAPVGLEEGAGTALFLDPALPSPFASQTSIPFGLPCLSACNLSIFDISGRLIRTLVDGELPGGGHVVTWDGSTASGTPCASGVYFIRLEAAGGSMGGKVLLLGD